MYLPIIVSEVIFKVSSIDSSGSDDGRQYEQLPIKVLLFFIFNNFYILLYKIIIFFIFK